MTVILCPNCKKPVEAKDYATHPVGSMMPDIECSCGYKGLPIKMKIKEYNKLIHHNDR